MVHDNKNPKTKKWFGKTSEIDRDIEILKHEVLSAKLGFDAYGLFLKKGRTIKAGTLLGEYTGDIVKENGQTTYYAFTLDNGMLVDAEDISSASCFRYANNSDERVANVAFKRVKNKILCYAIRDISDQEFCVSYGKKYFVEESNRDKIIPLHPSYPGNLKTEDLLTDENLGYVILANKQPDSHQNRILGNIKKHFNVPENYSFALHPLLYAILQNDEKKVKGALNSPQLIARPCLILDENKKCLPRTHDLQLDILPLAFACIAESNINIINLLFKASVVNNLHHYVMLNTRDSIVDFAIYHLKKTQQQYFFDLLEKQAITEEKDTEIIKSSHFYKNIEALRLSIAEDHIPFFLFLLKYARLHEELYSDEILNLLNRRKKKLYFDALVAANNEVLTKLVKKQNPIIYKKLKTVHDDPITLRYLVDNILKDHHFLEQIITGLHPLSTLYTSKLFDHLEKLLSVEELNQTFSEKEIEEFLIKVSHDKLSSKQLKNIESIFNVQKELVTEMARVLKKIVQPYFDNEHVFARNLHHDETLYVEVAFKKHEEDIIDLDLILEEKLNKDKKRKASDEEGRKLLKKKTSTEKQEKIEVNKLVDPTSLLELQETRVKPIIDELVIEKPTSALMITTLYSNFVADEQCNLLQEERNKYVLNLCNEIEAAIKLEFQKKLKEKYPYKSKEFIEDIFNKVYLNQEARKCSDFIKKGVYNLKLLSKDNDFVENFPLFIAAMNSALNQAFSTITQRKFYKISNIAITCGCSSCSQQSVEKKYKTDRTSDLKDHLRRELGIIHTVYSSGHVVCYNKDKRRHEKNHPEDSIKYSLLTEEEPLVAQQTAVPMQCFKLSS